MHVISLNVGMPREVQWRGDRVQTGIFKEPVAGRIPLRGFNLAGDAQADLSVHGGRDKSVYAYPSEYYEFWRAEAPDHEYRWGIFGENLTTVGLFENVVCIGDEYRVGTARLIVTQPRMPCFKLGIRMSDAGFVKRFLASRRPGIYFKVAEEGEIGAGDAIERLSTDPHQVTVTDMLALILNPLPKEEDLRRVLEIPDLAEVWREEFTERLG